MKVEKIDTRGNMDTPLYDESLLDRVDFSSIQHLFRPYITPIRPGQGLKVRPLNSGDYHRGFCQLLGQLTKVGDISPEEFLRRFIQMKNCPGTYYVTVIEDLDTNLIIGAASLIVEYKFIHNCGLRGRLEDVVVNDNYRGRQLGKLIVMTVTLLAKELGCYKMSLDCKDKLIPLYTSLGYAQEQGNANSMNIRFEDQGPS